MLNKCDNKNKCHNNQIINKQEDGIRIICKDCKEINIIRIGLDGRMNNRKYAKVFKKDILQPGENLYYKYNSHKMSII